MSRVFYNQADLKPHQSRYGLNAEPDALADVKMADLTTLYGQAPALQLRAGTVDGRNDRHPSAGAQHPTRLMEPGAERREFEYIRRGTVTLIANFDVAQAIVVTPSMGPTRTEEDFVNHIARTIASDPEVTRWHFVADNQRSFISPKAWCAWSPSMTRFPTTWGTRVSVAFSGL